MRMGSMTEMGGYAISAGVAAALTYLLDPTRGRTRRARVRDKVQSVRVQAREAAEKTTRDTKGRLWGAYAATLGGGIKGSSGASDEKVFNRIRSKLGRYTSHPRAIHVDVRDGCAVLSGTVLENEVSSLLRAVQRVRGVRDVRNSLRAVQTAESVPELQGGRPAPGERWEVFQENWSPSFRLFFFATSLLLVGAGFFYKRQAAR